jgi:hypothetical protein
MVSKLIAGDAELGYSERFDPENWQFVHYLGWVVDVPIDGII